MDSCIHFAGCPKTSFSLRILDFISDELMEFAQRYGIENQGEDNWTPGLCEFDKI